MLKLIVIETEKNVVGPLVPSESYSPWFVTSLPNVKLKLLF